MKPLYSMMASAMAAVGFSHASIDFEAVEGTLTQPVIELDGFRWTLTAGSWLVGEPAAAEGFENAPSNGTNILVAESEPPKPQLRSPMASLAGGGAGGGAGGSGALMSLVQLGAMNLYLIDAASSNTQFPSSLDVTGTRMDGTTISTVIVLGPKFETYALDGFTNLASVLFSSEGSGPAATTGFALDNVEAEAATVPLPSAFALMLVGFLGAAGHRLRRRT